MKRLLAESLGALEAMFAGPISGASMNPARSFGPCLVTGQFDHLWIYLTAPVLDAVFAAPLCLGVRGTACCGRAAYSEGVANAP